MWEGDSNAAGGGWGETSASADPSAACGGTSPPDGAESFTNEPELHEDVIRSQDQEIVEVTADSGVDSGLDKVADLLGAGGREAPEIGDPEFDAGLMPGVSCQSSVVSCRELLPATGDDGRGLGAGQTTRSVGEAAPTQSVERGGSRILPPRGAGPPTRSAPPPPGPAVKRPLRVGRLRSGIAGTASATGDRDCEETGARWAHGGGDQGPAGFVAGGHGSLEAVFAAGAVKRGAVLSCGLQKTWTCIVRRCLGRRRTGLSPGVSGQLSVAENVCPDRAWRQTTDSETWRRPEPSERV